MTFDNTVLKRDIKYEILGPTFLVLSGIQIQ